MFEYNKEKDFIEKKKKEEGIEIKEKMLNKIHHNKLKIDLKNLKILLEEGIIDKQLFEFIEKDSILSLKELQEIVKNSDVKLIFEKIDQILDFEDIDNIILPENKVSKQEYLIALKDSKKRDYVLSKFDASLDRIYKSYNGVSNYKKNMFSNYVNLLSSKLIPLQENIIDLKKPLNY